jgi:peptidoglycan/LPS O-acetylase OafA/YrhL
VELIGAVLLAGPIGYFSKTRMRGLCLYLIVWAVVFPIQTVVVFSMSDDGNDFMYWVVNAVILCAGIGLNAAGARLRERRLHTAQSVAQPAR